MVGVLMLAIMLSFSITIIVYLVILGNSTSKTDREKQLEDEEQIEYLKNYENRKLMKRMTKKMDKISRKLGKK